eukprot:TRINITY_DN2113_c0_g1_i1.p2 TRINITY_DN2113_c0_g1~~TRINITY_DN2113_c0_g1_i1.p2  ORF type:complete len:119 (+),score=39.56 TRINITY_DN2113_c0_g1_i1:92-448(+)
MDPELAAALTQPAAGVLVLWLLVAFASVFTLLQGRYSFLFAAAVPVGFLSIFLMAIVGRELSSLSGVPALAEFAVVFSPAKLKAVDVLLAGLLVMISFGFSRVTDELDKMSQTIATRA